MYIRSGSDINLTCVVLETPDPPSFIYWYRDRDVINYSGRGGISVVTEKQTRTSRLLISKAQPPDTGNYTCAPSASDSASVTVHVLNGDYIIILILIYTHDKSGKIYYEKFECDSIMRYTYYYQLSLCSYYKKNNFISMVNRCIYGN